MTISTQDHSQRTQNFINNPAFYKALTLTERLVSLRAQSTEQPLKEAQHTEAAMSKLRRWKEQAPFNQGTYFTDRLALEAMTENELLTLLGEPIEAVQARTSTTPNWLLKIAQAFEDAEVDGGSDSPMAVPAKASTLRENNAKLLNSGFVEALRPLIKDGLRRLHMEIRLLSQKYKYVPFDIKAVTGLFVPALPVILLPKIARTLVLELNVARLQGRLQGTTPEERFQDFIQLLDQKKGIVTIFEEYPILARQLMIAIDHWINYSLEFLHHLCEDWAQLCTTFSPESDPGVLVEVEGGAGDAHRGGRSVLKLKFSSGLRLVYKPKSLSIDVHFQELLEWLNERGDHPPFRLVRLLDRGTYGWSEFISARGCSSQEEVARFYERQGGYLALLYALEATDFHFENLIACGEQPILIDQEALFHPRIENNASGEFEQIGYDILRASVLRVGMLPQLIRLNEQGEGLDVSGLGGRNGQMTPHPVPNWDNVGTDQMRLVRQRMEITGKDNRPRLNGIDVDLLDYSDAIITGFAKIYRLLTKHREELLEGPLSRFVHEEIRIIVRPTSTYGQMLMESFHPDLLRDALDRDRFFDHLWLSVERQPYLAKFLAAERRDLLMGDIPMFTTYTDSRDVYSSDGQILPQLLEEPSLEAAKRCIKRLSEDDLAQQVWFIQASLATVKMGADQMARQNARGLSPSQTEVSYERLLKAACAVGDRICERAVHGKDDNIGWLGMHLINNRQWMLLPTSPDLYDGTGGIILFLAYLGAITSNEGYTTLARSALATVRRQVEQRKHHVQSLGVFDGWGALVYLLTHLGVLWNDATFFGEAEEWVEYLAPLIEKDDVMDIISGSAGCILALRNLYAVSPSERIRAVAIQCGDHLLARARTMAAGIGWDSAMAKQPLTGFSHGAGGMALSLLELATLSGEERFKRAALDAITYERSVFVPEKQNWPDLRDPEKIGHKASQTDEPLFMTAWCHGAPGVALARLASLKHLDDAMIREEIRIGLAKTIADGFGTNHSLCHGDLGNLDVVLVASQMLGGSSYKTEVRQLTAMLLDSVDVNGWLTGIPLGVESPGLMTGIAGIGYEFLRLAEPEKIPSVLLVGPPSL